MYLRQGTRGKLSQQVRTEVHSTTSSDGKLAHNVDSQNGMDAASVAALLQEARRAIKVVRGAIF